MEDAVVRANKIACVKNWLAPEKDFSDAKIEFAIDEAAAYILNYTNRRVLPVELYHLQCRIAIDLLLYMTPTISDTASGGDDGVIKNLQSIREDDTELIGQDPDHTFALSIGKNNQNMEFLKDYGAYLEMWRVTPRYRRCPLEPRPKRGEPIDEWPNPDANWRR